MANIAGLTVRVDRGGQQLLAASLRSRSQGRRGKVPGQGFWLCPVQVLPGLQRIGTLNPSCLGDASRWPLTYVPKSPSRSNRWVPNLCYLDFEEEQAGRLRLRVGYASVSFAGIREKAQLAKFPRTGPEKLISFQSPRR